MKIQSGRHAPWSAALLVSGVALVALLGGFTAAGLAADLWSLPAAPVPLVAGLTTDKRVQQDVVPGVTLYKFEIGAVSSDDAFEVNAGFVRKAADADPLIAALRAIGHEAKLVATADDGATGHAVRLAQRFGSIAEADAMVATLRAVTSLPGSSESLAVGFGRVFTAEDGKATTGPFKISLLAIAPTFKGPIRAAIGTDIVPGRETTTALAKRLDALAAINGGFFQFGRANGTDGGLAGLSIIDGRLINEGVEGRPALFLERNPDGSTVARIERKITTTITVAKAGTAPKRIDGTNRRPQVSVNCGRPFDTETTVALHDAVCSNDNAIIVYTPDFGATASTEIDGSARATEVVLAADGQVTAIEATAGHTIPPGGQVIQGIGAGGAWLAETFKPGDKAIVTRKLVNATGAEIALKAGVFAVNGGPTLVLDGGTIEADHAIEGLGNQDIPGYLWSKPNGNRANFYNGWYLRRNPRTAVGIAADGTILMMVSDGRAPKYSAGLSIRETALVMKHFGAVNAINLDGGGSSMMVVKGETQTLPSDAGNVERADGDAIVVFAK